MKMKHVEAVLAGMAKQGLPQMVISDPPAIFYLTGQWIIPGERMLVLYLSLEAPPRLFVNELFSLPASLGLEIVWFNDTQDGVEELLKVVDPNKPVGIDKNWPAHFLLRLMEKKGGSAFVNGSGIIDRIRMCKDEEEQARMREASRLNDLAMGQLIRLISPQYTELQLARLLPDIYDQLGAQGCSFEPIVAYGPNGADSHHEPEPCPLKRGDSIILDIGCKKDSYCSDMTRTVFYQTVSDHGRKVYDIVLAANRRAIEAVKPGTRLCDVDAAARDYIEAAGYGKAFTHRTGHFIGLDVHDFGDVSATNRDILLPGMIFSIEPSIKIHGELGVRVEDLVLVTEDGCEVLNRYDKELTVVE